jgi:hypothetical protein
MPSSGMLGNLALVRTTRSDRRLLVTAKVRSSPVLFTLMMGALCPSETSVPITATGHSIPEDGILHNHRRENLKCYCGILIRGYPVMKFMKFLS